MIRIEQDKINKYKITYEIDAASIDRFIRTEDDRQEVLKALNDLKKFVAGYQIVSKYARR